MTVRQAGAPITDTEHRDAAIQGGNKQMETLFSAANKDGPFTHASRCRPYPKFSLLNWTGRK